MPTPPTVQHDRRGSPQFLKWVAMTYKINVSELLCNTKFNSVHVQNLTQYHTTSGSRNGETYNARLIHPHFPEGRGEGIHRKSTMFDNMHPFNQQNPEEVRFPTGMQLQTPTKIRHPALAQLLYSNAVPTCTCTGFPSGVSGPTVGYRKPTVI